MNQHFKLLYQKLLTAIEKCRAQSSIEKEQIECAFKTAINYWDDIKKQLAGYIFENTNEEIDFYKNVKPKFTSHIEYFTMVYQSLFFVPDSGRPEALKVYWENEETRLERFIDKNSEFVKYYRAGHTEMDLQYFVARNNDLADAAIPRSYNMNSDFNSSHDYLVANLISQEMYHEYVKMKYPN